MSSVDIAVNAYRELNPLDVNVLKAIELLTYRYEYVPDFLIARKLKLSLEEVRHRLSVLHKYRLIMRWKGPYVGYVLNTAGYDLLAINALVRMNAIKALGKPLGVGKEADVYDALTPKGRQVAVKFHRLGRTSFRQTRKKRDYAVEERVSWSRQSRIAAVKEYEALKLVHPKGVSVPKPIRQNRHVVVMGMINGVELYHYKELPSPEDVLTEILLNVKKAYLNAGVIHADLSEFNIVLTPDLEVLIIDWPQYVTRDHPNAEELLRRDVQNVLTFFKRKHGVEVDVERALTYVRGGELSLSS